MKYFFEVNFDLTKSVIIYYNYFVFYGSEATDAIALKITKEAENQWNKSNSYVDLIGKRFQVKFLFEYEVDTLLKPSYVLENKFPFRKYFRIEAQHEGNISFVDGIHSNTGFLVLKNINTPQSTTFAHELGHCYGLVHPEDLNRLAQSDPPHIMYPRGTLVQPQYQYKPDRKVILENGFFTPEEGATLNPIYREVTQKNIDDLAINKYFKSFDKGFNISKLSKKYHYFKG